MNAFGAHADNMNDDPDKEADRVARQEALLALLLAAGVLVAFWGALILLS